jgi:hypothetical protein
MSSKSAAKSPRGKSPAKPTAGSAGKSPGKSTQATTGRSSPRKSPSKRAAAPTPEDAEEEEAEEDQEANDGEEEEEGEEEEASEEQEAEEEEEEAEAPEQSVEASNAMTDVDASNASEEPPAPVKPKKGAAAAKKAAAATAAPKKTKQRAVVASESDETTAAPDSAEEKEKKKKKKASTGATEKSKAIRRRNALRAAWQEAQKNEHGEVERIPRIKTSWERNAETGEMERVEAEGDANPKLLTMSREALDILCNVEDAIDEGLIDEERRAVLRRGRKGIKRIDLVFATRQYMGVNKQSASVIDGANETLKDFDQLRQEEKALKAAQPQKATAQGGKGKGKAKKAADAAATEAEEKPRLISKRLGLNFSVGATYKSMKQALRGISIGKYAPLWNTAVKDCILLDFMRHLNEKAREQGDARLQPEHIREFVEISSLLRRMLGQNPHFVWSGMTPHVEPSLMQAAPRKAGSKGKKPSEGEEAFLGMTKADVVKHIMKLQRKLDAKPRASQKKTKKEQTAEEEEEEAATDSATPSAKKKKQKVQSAAKKPEAEATKKTATAEKSKEVVEAPVAAKATSTKKSQKKQKPAAVEESSMEESQASAAAEAPKKKKKKTEAAPADASAVEVSDSVKKTKKATTTSKEEPVISTKKTKPTASKKHARSEEAAEEAPKKKKKKAKLPETEADEEDVEMSVVAKPATSKKAKVTKKVAIVA